MKMKSAQKGVKSMLDMVGWGTNTKPFIVSRMLTRLAKG